MKKKRFLPIVLGFMLALALTACGGAQTGDSSEKPQSASPGEQKTEDTTTDVQTAEPAKTITEPETEPAKPEPETEAQNTEKTLRLLINDSEVAVEWEKNESVAALIELVSSKGLTVQMSMYGGFEQVGSLGQSLPRNDGQTTTSAGDIVLYSGDQIVVFYGSNSWAYTRLGKITDRSAADMKTLLGNGNVTLTIKYGG